MDKLHKSMAKVGNPSNEGMVLGQVFVLTSQL